MTVSRKTSPPCARGIRPPVRRWRLSGSDPGAKAVRMHRRADWFYRHGMLFLARAISQRAVRKTGIEIHPAAKLGRRLFIDHGTGVVIGETAEIGDDCHASTRGSRWAAPARIRANAIPPLGNHVMVGSGCQGARPVQDRRSTPASPRGRWCSTKSRPDATAVGVPARVVRQREKCCEELDQVHVPDPVAQELCALEGKIERLERTAGRRRHPTPTTQIGRMPACHIRERDSRSRIRKDRMTTCKFSTP